MKVKFAYYQDGEFWIGWLEDYPDYKTQGYSLDELKENLKDIYDDITNDRVSLIT